MPDDNRLNEDGYLELKRVIFSRNLKTIIGPGLSNVSDAEELYFTGAAIPEIKQSKNLRYKYYTVFPIYFREIYVPKEYNSIYKKWFKKYDSYKKVHWHTYDPAEMFGSAEGQ